jgi:RNA polymerase sigma-70 factor (ECF subfamily)
MTGNLSDWRDPPMPLSNMADAELYDAWCSGDTRAGSALTKRHLRGLRSFFERKVRDRDTAADLVQLTLEKLVKSRDKLVDLTRFRSFLFGIAWHVLKDHYREHSRERLLFMDDEQIDLARTTLAQLGIPAPTEPSRRGGLLVHALHRLPIESQQMLMLQFKERMKYDEIAEVFDIPPGTVASRLNNARKQLRQTMQALEITDEGLSSKCDSISTWALEIRIGIEQPLLDRLLPRRLGGGWRLVQCSCDGEVIQARYRRPLRGPVVELELRRTPHERSDPTLDVVSIRNREWIRQRDRGRRECTLRHLADGRELRLIHRPSNGWDSLVELVGKLDLDKLASF